MEQVFSLKYILASIVYSLLGLAFYGLGFYIFERITPGQLWKELIEEHNTALAIVVGSMSIGIALIISSAIHS